MRIKLAPFQQLGTEPEGQIEQEREQENDKRQQPQPFAARFRGWWVRIHVVDRGLQNGAVLLLPAHRFLLTLAQ